MSRELDSWWAGNPAWWALVPWPWTVRACLSA